MPDYSLNPMAMDVGFESRQKTEAIERLREENTRLRDALEPFAKIATSREIAVGVADDCFPVNLGLMNGNVTQSVIRNKLTVGDFRKALRSLSGGE